MDLALTAFETLNDIQEQILDLKKEKKAIILGHNYQRKEVQEISDFLGDSYGLSVQASKTDAEIIVFCGVDFMAESAKILNPQKIVLHPNLKARCPMSAMVDVKSLKDLKAAHPGAPVVSYVNTSADVKAESDICCTSANAVKIVQSLPDKKVIFVPDTNLGLYVQRFVKDKELIFWPGYCPTHVNIKVEDLKELKTQHPNAEILVHPECTSDVIDFADHAYSTEGIIRHVASSPKKEFIIGTETNMLHRLRNEAPGKLFYAVPSAICPNMREIILEDVRDALTKMQYKVELPADIIRRARIPLERMIAAGRQN
ncbi:MAG: quinolinate synthase NadA [Candidatus Thermoplasmatota archaeon]|nr:quinolinate synthase NadA [Candidatus Thermoplasmatota archaeon]